MKISLQWFLSFMFLSNVNTYAQNFQWAKAFGGTGNEKGLSVNVDSQGDVYTMGFFNGTVDFDPGPGIFNLTTNGTQSLYISKLSNSGIFIWAKTIDLYKQDLPSITAVDDSGNIYITGVFQGIVDFDPDPGVYTMNSTWAVFVLKLNASGSFGWVKKFEGGTYSYGNAVAVDHAGNVYVTGNFEGTLDFNPDTAVYALTNTGLRDVFVVKLNPSGNFIWAKAFGGSASMSSGKGWSVAVSNSGNVATTGEYAETIDFDPGAGTYNLTSTNGSSDIFIQMLDSSGNFLWAKAFGSMQQEQGWSVAFDMNSNLYSTGYFRETIDFDPGSGIYNLGYPGNDDQIYILKLNPQGNFIWAKAMGGLYQDQARGLAVDIYGSVYATGYYNQVADFDPGTATYNLTTAGSWDIFLVKLDSSGNFGWAKSVGGITPEDLGYAITIDSSLNVFTAGYFTDIVDFDPGTGSYNLISAGNGDAFVLKLSSTPTGINELSNGSSSFGKWVFPNPCSETTTIHFSIPQSQKISLKIFDLEGRLVSTVADACFDPGEYRFTVNATEMNSGIYLLQFQSGGVLQMEKLVVTK